MPRAIALGGASAAPNPGQGCSGYLIEDGDLRLVLDLGPGTLTELLRHCEIGSVSGIVITHFHVDHILDLVALWWGWLHHPVPLPASIPLWLPPGGTSTMRRILSTFGRIDEVDRFFHEICSVTEYSVKKPIHVGSTTISFAPTAHYVPCWAVRIDLPTSVVAYTADTGPAADLTTLARDADILIAESMVVGPFNESLNRGSSTPIEAATLAHDAHVKRLVLTHFWSKRDSEEALRQANSIFSGPTYVAYPGLTISW